MASARDVQEGSAIAANESGHPRGTGMATSSGAAAATGTDAGAVAGAVAGGDATRHHRSRPTVRLNEAQRRALAITVRLLEERLSTIRDLLDRDDGGVLYERQRPRFTPEETARIEALLARMHGVIASVGEAFALPREERDARGMIVALLAMSWQSLGEIDARGMRAYGETDPALGRELDPYVRELMDLVLALETAVAGG